jgi:hypothetical protein
MPGLFDDQSRFVLLSYSAPMSNMSTHGSIIIYLLDPPKMMTLRAIKRAKI